MIQFDNGPAGGDFVRYIDGILAQRMPVASMESDGFVAAASGTTGVAVTDVDGATAPRLSRAQASAIARSALTSQGFQPNVVKAWLDVIGLVAGGALALAGLFFGGAFGVWFTLIGIALAATRVKRLFQRPTGP